MELARDSVRRLAVCSVLAIEARADYTSGIVAGQVSTGHAREQGSWRQETPGVSTQAARCPVVGKLTSSCGSLYGSTSPRGLKHVFLAARPKARPLHEKRPGADAPVIAPGPDVICACLASASPDGQRNAGQEDAQFDQRRQAGQQSGRDRSLTRHGRAADGPRLPGATLVLDDAVRRPVMVP